MVSKPVEASVWWILLSFLTYNTIRGNGYLCGKARRHGYIFTWSVGDHMPVHIHVYKDGRLVCRWRLFENTELSGKANAKIQNAIRELRVEGVFAALERVNYENK